MEVQIYAKFELEYLLLPVAQNEFIRRNVAYISYSPRTTHEANLNLTTDMDFHAEQINAVITYFSLLCALLK